MLYKVMFQKGTIEYEVIASGNTPEEAINKVLSTLPRGQTVTEPSATFLK